MEKIYNAEEAKKRIEKRIAYYAERVAAWEKVERIRKKDGNDFANLAKNFTNCKIVNSYSWQELTVYFRSDIEGYTSDYINISGNQYQEAADTPEKIEKRIAEQIEKYNGYKETAEKALQEIESDLAKLTPELETLKKALKEAAEKNTQYIVQSYIKNYLHILND